MRGKYSVIGFRHWSMLHTFLRYLVVLATARTPLRIALVLKWCSTTWLGTGRTLPSSAIPDMSSFADFFDGVAVGDWVISSPGVGGAEVAGAEAEASVPRLSRQAKEKGENKSHHRPPSRSSPASTDRDSSPDRPFLVPGVWSDPSLCLYGVPARPASLTRQLFVGER